MTTYSDVRQALIDLQAEEDARFAAIEAKLAAANVTIADLQAQLDAQVIPPEPPPPVGTSVFGFAGGDPSGKARVLRVYLDPGEAFPKPIPGILHFITYKGSGDHDVRAKQARLYAAPLLLGFHHEPEGPGGPDYVPGAYKSNWAAFDKALKDNGVTNVRRTWVMMGSSFTGKTGDTADNYYPGNSLVDVIGADGYDWCGCKTNAGQGNPTGSHRQFKEIFAHMRSYAAARGKEMAIGEVGSPMLKSGDEHDRVIFINSMVAEVLADKKIIAVCYYNLDNRSKGGCDWLLKGDSLAAYQAAL